MESTQLAIGVFLLVMIILVVVLIKPDESKIQKQKEIKSEETKPELKKVALGQFFTKENTWCKNHIVEFIKSSNCNIAYDPFAGAGDLLKVAEEKLNMETVGTDIDPSLKWKINDSLVNIPKIENSIIITNPPYLAKQSASRKKINLDYFNNSKYDDLYLIALDKMLEASDFVVAIIPESFINSNYLQKNKLHSITILEENPFEDTTVPVCVACFDGINKFLSDVQIYKNDKFVHYLETIIEMKPKVKNNIKISFNDLNGWLGLRAVDSSDDNNKIIFDFKDNFEYDWENNIKVSSRNFSLINIDVEETKRELFIKECNKILAELREQSQDIVFTPFMGNTKNGIRRRRLDFKMARAILEQAYKKINNEK